jgi:phosphatidylglycerol:prolipoprotein diacylglycerol transferase
MYPVLLELKCFGWQLVVPTYPAALAIALVIFCITGWIGLQRAGLGWAIAAAYVFAVVLATLVGARGAAVALTAQESAQAAKELYSLQVGHFYLLGGLLLGIGTACALGRLSRHDSWQILDALTPATALAMAVARLGCFGAGCCFGKEATVPWAVQFPPGSAVHLYQLRYDLSVLSTGPHRVHPTQLYLVAVALAIFALALLIRRVAPRPGSVALGAMVIFLLTRCWIDTYRAEVGPFSPRRDQVVCALGAVVCLLLLWQRWKQSRRVRRHPLPTSQGQAGPASVSPP